MKMLSPIVAVLCLATMPAFADGRTQLLSGVNQELPRYVSGVDTSVLSNRQLGLIKAAIHGGGSDGQKQARIRSILGGRYSLFGTLRIGIGN